MALATALDLINGTLNNVSTQLDANFDVYPTLYNALSEAGHVKFGGARTSSSPSPTALRAALGASSTVPKSCPRAAARSTRS